MTSDYEKAKRTLLKHGVFVPVCAHCGESHEVELREAVDNERLCGTCPETGLVLWVRVTDCLLLDGADDE